MEKVMEFVDGRMNQLDRGIVATPHMEYLDAFAKANRGSNDFLLMQMAIQYGYKMAMEDIAEIVELQS